MKAARVPASVPADTYDLTGLDLDQAVFLRDLLSYFGACGNGTHPHSELLAALSGVLPDHKTVWSFCPPQMGPVSLRCRLRP